MIFSSNRRKLKITYCIYSRSSSSSGKFLGYIVTHRGIEANLEQIRAINAILSLKSMKELHKLTGIMEALRKFISRLSDKSHSLFETLKNPKDFQWSNIFESTLTDLKSLPYYASSPVKTAGRRNYVAIPGSIRACSECCPGAGRRK